MANRFEVFTIQELQAIRMGMVYGKLEEELKEAVGAKLKAASDKINNLPVYGGTIFWHDPRNTNQHKQARVVVAGKSRAEINRTFPCLKRIEMTKTGNGDELTAVQEPLTIYIRPLNSHNGHEYFKLTPEETDALR
jgi:hypothetical protein